MEVFQMSLKDRHIAFIGGGAITEIIVANVTWIKPSELYGAAGIEPFLDSVDF